jgi:nucleotide-binding universal stress UspA family protein
MKSEAAPTIDFVAEETGVNMGVVSGHMLTGQARATLGSVADAVVRTSHRPMLATWRPGGLLEGTEAAV